MKNSKTAKFFGKGRKIIFSLALFLLVFALASVVKIQAAGNVTGWLWGGSEDKNIGGSYGVWPPDGNETGIGEIRMKGKTQDNLYEYGVTIPSSDGIISGGNNFAWSENIGWIDFDGVHVTAVGDEKRLSGQARIIAIRDAGENAGGWQGWIKLAADGTGAGCTGASNYTNGDKCNYGVKIDSNGNFSGYGWNGEEPGSGDNMANGLGWIDFSRVRYTVIPYIDLTPASFSLGGTSQTLRAEIKDAAPAGQTISFAKSGANPDKFNLSATSCNVGTNGWCNVNVTAADRSSAFTATITASSAGITSDSSNGTIIRLPVCAISCPESFTIAPDGAWHSYDCSVSGEAGCRVDSCSKLSGSSKISVQAGSALNTCEVKAETSARYDTAVSRATAGTGSDDTNISVKNLGWIETNP